MRNGEDAAKMLPRTFRFILRKLDRYEGPVPKNAVMEPPPPPPPEPANLIMLQFLTWVADRPRNYAQAMEAWRSTCPRLSVWEDAIIGGLVRVENGPDRAVTLTRGQQVLQTAPEQPR
jgi:hypothetical protein